MPVPLLIVGASGRAAAASALRAGYSPFVIDLFADADTRRLCPVLKCDPADYPHGFIPLAKQAPASPWMYTGGLENYPEVVAAISETRELIGNGPDVLRKARDPWLLSRLGGFAPVRPRGEPVPLSGSLRKPLRGSGGGGIRVATEGDDPDDPDHFYQEFVTGEPLSEVFRAGDGGVHFLGGTRQLVGCDWLHAKPFQYCGNISTGTAAAPVHRFAERVADAADLRGLFGLDFVGAEVVEVNPRYTAGAEVLELAGGIATLRFDPGERGASAPCWFGRNRGLTPPARQPRTTVGKAIYYAPVAFAFPASGPWDESRSRCTDVWVRPDFADLPNPGAAIGAGQPVLTILAEADTETACEMALRTRATALDRLFGV